MKKRLNAELWDKMHYLFRDFNDRMVHVELNYDFEVGVGETPVFETNDKYFHCNYNILHPEKSSFTNKILS